MIAGRLATIPAAAPRTRSGLVKPEALVQAGFAAFALILVLIGAGGVLNYVFTPLSIAVALYLYRRAPTRDYLSFCLWLWMLAPLVRRLADWQGDGFQQFSPIIVAPLAVSLLAGLRAGRRSFWSFAPFTAIIVVYLYGALVGVMQGQTAAAAYTLANWAVPVILGCYVLSFPSKRDEITEALFRTFAVGGFLLSLYALDQYLNLRPWDAHWMVASEMRSIGAPFPQMVRVFGTMSAPGPFAVLMFASLLVTLSSTSWLRWIAMPPVVAALALSLVRSAWGALALGLIVLLVFGRRRRLRHVAVALVAVLLALPLLAYEPIGRRLAERLDTLANLQSDSSFNARIRFTDAILDRTDVLLIGNGLGTTGLGTKLAAGEGAIRDFDNGVLDLFYNFGLMAVVMLGALAATAFGLLRRAALDRQTQVSAAVAVGGMSQLVFGNSLAGFSGLCIFPFVAIALLRRA